MRAVILDTGVANLSSLAFAVKRLGVEPVITREAAEIRAADRILLPGVGTARAAMAAIEARGLAELIREATQPVLGICLGEQAIGEAFGAKLTNLSSVYHGISSKIKITKQDEYTFAGLPAEIEVGRYHSWVVDAEGLPECLEVTSETEDGLIMGLRHKTYDVRGVQFHPESVLTPSGKTILENFLKK